MLKILNIFDRHHMGTPIENETVKNDYESEKSYDIPYCVACKAVFCHIYDGRWVPAQVLISFFFNCALKEKSFAIESLSSQRNVYGHIVL